MTKFYELTIDGEDLKAKLCEPIDEYGEGVTDGYEAEMFKDRKIFQFFKKHQNGEYDIAWGQDILEYKGKIILPLNEQECLTSDSPIDRFSWEDDFDIDSPNHKIILESQLMEYEEKHFLRCDSVSVEDNKKGIK